MEKRNCKRFNVCGDVNGRMVLVSELAVEDLSRSGIRFCCSERVVPRSRIQLVVRMLHREVTLPGGRPLDAEDRLRRRLVEVDDV